MACPPPRRGNLAHKDNIMSHKDVTTRPYEVVLVFQPELLESTLEKKLREFDKFIEENDGKVDMKDNWGKRQLAYQIGKFDAGIYVVYNLTLPTSFNRELDEHMRIDKDIIRFLQLSLPDGYHYTRYTEEVKAESKEEKTSAGKSKTSHKAGSKEKTSDDKDKGKKADAGSLDDKLDKLLEGEDLNM